VRKFSYHYVAAVGFHTLSCARCLLDHDCFCAQIPIEMQRENNHLKLQMRDIEWDRDLSMDDVVDYQEAIRQVRIDHQQMMVMVFVRAFSYREERQCGTLHRYCMYLFEGSHSGGRDDEVRSTGN